MQIRMRIEAVITLPEGTTVPEEGRAFTLPSGDWLKPFIVMEMNDLMDLGHSDLMQIGVDIEEQGMEIEVVEWAREMAEGGAL